MKPDKLKIAIIVHGRFHAFDLARALIDQGHHTILFTNYPKWAVRRFGICSRHVRSFWLHGILSRLTQLLYEIVRFPYPEAWLHKIFGRWALKELKKESWDVIHCWSGISEEILKILKDNNALKILMRGSSHISLQAAILEEEEKRTGISIHRPSQWMLAREKREYALADYIMALSKFAYTSFVKEAVGREKLVLLPLAADAERFRPSPEIIKNRQRRIMGKDALRILYVGAFSLRKGIREMIKITAALEGKGFRFRLVGAVTREGKKLLNKFGDAVQLDFKKPEHELPALYAWGDIFIFPTIEDGYAQVLAQAKMCGLPIITTTNCAGPDMILEGKTGWVVPSRNHEGFIDRLLWCDAHRSALAQMANDVYENSNTRDWQDVAEDFAGICSKLIKKKLDGRRK